MRSASFVLLLLLTLWLPPSAMALQPGDEQRVEAGALEQPAELQWPRREASLVLELEVGPWELRWVGDLGLGFQPEDRADARALAEQLGDADRDIRYEGGGSIVVRMPSGVPSATARLAGKPVAAYEFLSADETESGALQLQRTWFALYDPRLKEGEDSKGLVVLLPGMFGTPEPVIDSLVGMLRKRGWHVLRMLTHPSRFTEQATYVVAPDGDIEAIAGAIAADLGDRTAECAIAIDAVCDHIAETRPEVPVTHRVGLGMSGGGMALSTVIAHRRDAYAAAVFIGAGCDFAQISMESNYTDWIDAVRVSWRGEVIDAPTRGRFTAAYREAAGFDGYQTAPRLGGLPILMIHGEVDQAVPAATGDLLWERLGRPERWSAALGHETLFLAYLPSRAGDLLDWLDDNTPPGPEDRASTIDP